MEGLDIGYISAAIHEAQRAGLFYTGLKRVPGGCIVQETWMDPVFAYCGAAA